MSELAHVVRTHHIDTGAIEMMCGERREQWEDPARDTAMCGGCAVELVNLLKHRIDDLHDEVQGRERTARIRFGATSNRLEAIEEDVRVLRKVVKRQDKRDKPKG